LCKEGSQLKQRFVHVDGYASSKYASDNKRFLVQREIDATFENRGLISAEVNVGYIELRFLEDAREVVFERMRNAIERHGKSKHRVQ